MNNGNAGDENDSLIRLPLKDYSKLPSQAFEDQVITPISRLIQKSPGSTPLYPAVYEAIKMLRGQPVTIFGVNFEGYMWGQPHKHLKQDSNGKDYYEYKLFETPLRYRCQQTHLVIMTDGEPNTHNLWGLDPNDGIESAFILPIYNVSPMLVNGVKVSDTTRYLTGKQIGQITAKADLRYGYKPIYKNGQWVEKELDDAGKSWTDELSSAMPIITHSVSLFVDPLSRVYLDMTEPTGGMNLGFAKDQGNAEDLLLAFDTIFSSIIRSTSSTMSTNDRNNSEVLEGKPEDSNGVDLSQVGTIRYDTTYNFNQQKGNIRAMIPYISEYVTIDGEQKPIIDVVELWNTDNTIQSEQGNYVTFLASNNGKLTHLSDPDVKKQ